MESNAAIKPQEVSVIQEQEEFTELPIENVEIGLAETVTVGQEVEIEAEPPSIPNDQPITEAGQAKEKEQPLTIMFGPPPSKRFCSAERTESEITEDLCVALVDKGHLTGAITLSQWQLVEVALLEAMMHMTTYPHVRPPRFDDAGWQAGAKLIQCSDVHSLKWLCATVDTLPPLWPSAKLAVVGRNWKMSLIKAKVNLPFIMPQEIAMNLLKFQNPDVVTSDWQVISVRPEDHGQRMMLKISKESASKIVANNGRIFWGMGTVHVHVQKQNQEKKNKRAKNQAAGQTPVENGLPNAEAPVNGDQNEIVELPDGGDNRTQGQ
ncbi:hypothetical protein AWZ03_007617 [Drosophila navojoa]|uniref:DUF4780 domain-containing protein n=1 Tax=Drosophila navojoa TaxID=7232 RepID=A0A484BAL3_DRONA|nr:hypothetical protein AWZ03_007617 [Drosophila navojoa]